MEIKRDFRRSCYSYPRILYSRTCRGMSGSLNLQVQQNRIIKTNSWQSHHWVNHNDIYPRCSCADGWYRETPRTFSQWNCDCGKTTNNNNPAHICGFKTIDFFLYSKKLFLFLIEEAWSHKASSSVYSNIADSFLYGVDALWSHVSGVRPNPLMLAWVTNVSTNPNLYIDFSTEHRVLKD